MGAGSIVSRIRARRGGETETAPDGDGPLSVTGDAPASGPAGAGEPGFPAGGALYLTRLMYASRSRDLDSAAVAAIVADARKLNAARQITGMLLLGDGFFLQCLEGDRAAVSDLYHHIARDRRHEGVQLLQVTAITGRDFPGWAMGYVSDTVAVRSAVRRFSPTMKFNPFAMGADSALALARHLGTTG